MHRVYFDENAGDERGRYDLGIPGSRQDLERMPGKLSDGAHVMLYDGQEIEVEAIIEFDPASSRWMAAPLWNTVRRLDDQLKSPNVVK